MQAELETAKGLENNQAARNAVLEVLKKISAVQFVNRQVDQPAVGDNSRPRRDDRDRGRNDRGSRYYGKK
jgi:hypothetical protein